MNTDSPLARLAASCGIESGYHDIWGNWHALGEDTARSLLGAMGLDATDDATTEAELRAGEINLVHVQVQNTGAGDATATAVHLLFADTEGTPARAPDFDGGAWGVFPRSGASKLRGNCAPGWRPPMSGEFCTVI